MDHLVVHGTLHMNLPRAGAGGGRVQAQPGDLRLQYLQHIHHRHIAVH